MYNQTARRVGRACLHTPTPPDILTSVLFGSIRKHAGHPSAALSELGCEVDAEAHIRLAHVVRRTLGSSGRPSQAAEFHLEEHFPIGNSTSCRRRRIVDALCEDCGTKSSSPSSSGVNSVTTAPLLAAAERRAPPAPVRDEDRTRRATAEGAGAWRCWKLRTTLTQELDESSTSGASM